MSRGGDTDAQMARLQEAADYYRRTGNQAKLQEVVQKRRALVGDNGAQDPKNFLAGDLDAVVSRLRQ